MTREQAYTFTDAQRMELRSYVQLAGEVIAQYWPMRTFIHHNPLHGLESMPFDEAVKRGAALFRGLGYLRNDAMRRHLRSGRIRAKDLHAALEPLAVDKHIVFAGRPTSHLDVLSASMIHGITEGPEADDQEIHPEESEAVATIESWLGSASDILDSMSCIPMLPWDSRELPIRETLGAWVDRTMGTLIVETVNREMVKWCSAFLDEGEATWFMPNRHDTFYRAWTSLAQHDGTLRLIGIRHAAKKIRALSARPEDVVLESLTRLKIPKEAWDEHLSLHLAAMPGWTGYIKWRANQSGYPWQQQFPVDLVQYLAVRLFYERELVERRCRDELNIDGSYDEIRAYIDRHPHACWVRGEWVGGRLPKPAAKVAQRLSRSNRHDSAEWDELGRQQYDIRIEREGQDRRHKAAQYLARLARALSLDTAAIQSTAPSDIRTALHWLEGFPPSQHGLRWLEAFEASYQRQVLDDLVGASGGATAAQPVSVERQSRPLVQIVFCIDVRSEVFRRHLEHRGGYETLGLAGFFGVPLDYQPFGAHYSVAHCPVLLKPKNQVREVPRSYHGAVAERHKAAAQFSEAAHTLVHDLKQNVVTPYVMVEALGWFFSLPLFGKTLLPHWYYNAARWMKRLLMPSVATTLTVEKMTREEAEEMIAAEQRAQIREILREQLGLHGAAISPALLDEIRRKALGHADGTNGEVAKLVQSTSGMGEAFYQELRERYRINLRGISERLERLTKRGFSITEQAYFVEAGLRLMGLTSNFARVVLFCAHGSTSQNNPYESALDCGACGGNQGLPNARTIAAMANKPAVRELLRARGINIPTDTHFFAAQHDTTNDRVRIVDLEDVPATHRKDLHRLIVDLEEAGTQAALERGLCLDALPTPVQPGIVRQFAQRRSENWAEVRPEWGLSKNSLMIIARRSLTQTVNLHGRAFLHSYDYRQDASGKLLETIMTAPLVVAQWINMEHYFSTVDNEVYGSGSKAYHNVVGRIGVMTGASSDLRIGLPAQTVLNGSEAYHEPMRLLTVIEAPRGRISAIIQRQRLLQQLFHGQWMALVALDPEHGELYRYDATRGWQLERGGPPYGQPADAASHEGN